MDIFDRATEQEEKERARDYEAEICNGCTYATRSNYGKACEAWVECLQDLVKRERAGR